MNPTNEYYGAQPRGYNDCVACGEVSDIDALLCGWCKRGAQEYNQDFTALQTDPDFDTGNLGYWASAGERIAQREAEQAYEDELQTKAVVVREGSALYTAAEQCQNFVAEACALLGKDFEQIRSTLEEECAADDYDEDEAWTETVEDFEALLDEAGYTTVWNDGVVIYKDLSDGAAEYVNDHA